MEKIHLTVCRSDRGSRLDRFLAGRLEKFSRARIQSLIKNGCILADGRNVPAHRKVREGMTVDVRIPPEPDNRLKPENIPLETVYEDGDIIVLNKPAGLVVHPAAGHSGGTLVNALLYHCGDLQGIGGELRPGIVHRLDKDTSGIMVVAKNYMAMNFLSSQFKARSVVKRYLAIVRGAPVPAAGRIETLIGRSRGDRKKMTTRVRNGRKAVSFYKTLEVFRAGYSFLELRIETGRTHQIRVHMAHMGCPVAGDRQYGVRVRGAVRRSKDVEEFQPCRQMLHAESICFIHPGSGVKVEYHAPLPADMQSGLSALRGGA